MPKLTRANAHALLKDLTTEMHDQHPDNRARLEQLDAHVATVAMVVDHLFDEAARLETKEN